MKGSEGRVIHIVMDITLTPRDDEGELGHTDAAFELGLGIVDDIMKLLHIVATNEGFKVDVERRNTVY